MPRTHRTHRKTPPASRVVLATIVATTAAAVAVISGAGGCADFIPTEGARIKCKSDTECPTTWTCEAAVARCIPQVRADKIAPELSDTSIDPSAGSTGTDVTITFIVDSVLDHNPAVTVGGAAATVVEQGGDGAGYTV